ncbi:MAG: TlpA disulfide reductase family protein [Gemmatimonadales bacterium]|jgi:thiol-disulfide isomerase/thioredoxin
MRANVLAGLGAAAALALAAPAGLRAQDDDVGLPVGTAAPAAAVQGLDGQPVDLAQLVGKKPVLLEFWATWCPLCQALLPRIEAAHTKFGDRVDIVVIAVAVNETRASVQRHLAQHPLPFRFLWDATGAAVRAYQAPTTSYVVALDARGRVVYTGTGENQDIDAALRRAAGS